MANQDVQLRNPGTNPWDVSLSTPAEELVLPTRSNGWTKMDGVWRRGTLWARVGADWKQVKPYAKVNGNWE